MRLGHIECRPMDYYQMMEPFRVPNKVLFCQFITQLHDFVVAKRSAKGFIISRQSYRETVTWYKKSCRNLLASKEKRFSLVLNMKLRSKPGELPTCPNCESPDAMYRVNHREPVNKSGVLYQCSACLSMAKSVKHK